MVVNIMYKLVYSAAGRSVCSAGDINEDGYADFLVGAPGAPLGYLGNAQSGHAYIILGKPRSDWISGSLDDTEGSIMGTQDIVLDTGIDLTDFPGYHSTDTIIEDKVNYTHFMYMTSLNTSDVAILPYPAFLRNTPTSFRFILSVNNFTLVFNVISKLAIIYPIRPHPTSEGCPI